MDWLGIFLNTGTYSTPALAPTFGVSQWAWDDDREIAMIMVFGVITLTFIATQYFAVFTTKERRIFPAKLLRQRSMILPYF